MSKLRPTKKTGKKTSMCDRWLKESKSMPASKPIKKGK